MISLPSGKTRRTDTIHGRIRRDIENGILSGRWRPGDKIPREFELAERYGCARMTVNKAMTDLATAGLITRRKGAGTVVSHPRSHQALLEIPDLKASMEAGGGVYGYELLKRERRAARQDDTDRLSVRAGSEILDLKCRHWRSGVPFAIELRMINVAEAPTAVSEDFTVTPPNKWLVAHIPWTEAEHDVQACGASPEIASLLGIEPGAACLVVNRRTWHQGKNITSVAMTHPGHLYRLVGRFGPTGTPASQGEFRGAPARTGSPG